MYLHIELHDISEREAFRAKNEWEKKIPRPSAVAGNLYRNQLATKNPSKFFSGKFPINYFRLNWFAFG